MAIAMSKLFIIHLSTTNMLKKNLEFITLTVIALLSLFQSQNVLAQQRISITGNFNAFSFERVQDPDTGEIAFAGETSFSGNVRFFDKSLWAFRLGVGSSELEYELNDGFATNYDVIRNNLTAYLGLEKHFQVGPVLPYLGAFVPINFSTEDVIGSSQDSFRSGDVRAGFGLLAGAQLKLLKIFRVGAEFNMGYNKFKTEVIDNFSEFNLNRLDYNTEITVGVAF